MWDDDGSSNEGVKGTVGESPEERRIRKRRERQEYLKRQAEIDQYIAEELDKNPEFAKEHDAAFDREFEDLFGVTPYDYGVKLDHEYLKGQGVSKKDIDEAERIMRQARKTAKGGWFGGGNPKKAAKQLKGNKAVKKVGDATKKKGKGCAVVGLLILVVGSSSLAAAVYGAAQAIAAVLP